MSLLPLVLLACYVESYNILVISPAIGVSHMNFMGRIADTLTDAGHNVTYYVNVLNTDIQDKIGVKTTKNVIKVMPVHDLNEKGSEMSNKMWSTSYGVFDIYNLMNSLVDVMGGYGPVYENFFADMNVFNQLKEQKFDIAFGETVCAYPMAIMEALNIPARFMVQTEVLRDVTAWTIGEKIDYTTVPSIYGVSSDKMSLLERLDSALRAYLHSKAHSRTYDAEVEQYRKYLGNDVPAWEELFSKAAYVAYNSNRFLDFPRQILPKTLQIGGLTVDVEKWRSQGLSEEFEQILSIRPKNVLISFGSMARSSEMPKEYRFNLLKVIKSFPEVTFLWKYETDNLTWASGVENVKFFKWIPQTAVLASPKLSAFLTHGGLGSIHEVAYLGVPSITVPLTFDQPRNARMLERHGGSIFFEKDNLGDFGALRAVMEKILMDESYSANAAKLVATLKYSPVDPKDTLLRYVNFAGKTGNLETLDPYSKQLSIFTTLYLDVILIVTAVVLLLSYPVIILLKCASQSLFTPKKKCE